MGVLLMDDYISRQAILDEAKRLSGPITGDGWDNWGVYALIERQPPADVRPVVRPVVRAHWEEYEFMGERAYRCSNCKCMAPASWSLDGSYDLEGQFCDSCGADMRETEP